MIEKLHIENFKNIKSALFDLRPLTVLTGLNSTGKSSIIQAILLLSKFYSENKNDVLNTQVAHFSDFTEVRNKYENAKFLKIVASTINNEFSLEMSYDDTLVQKNITGLDYEKNVYYISANRSGQEQLAQLSKEQKTGQRGEYIFGYFENHRDSVIETSLVKFPENITLKGQVNAWLTYILGFEISLNTEKVTKTDVKVSFSSGGIDDINPFNVGAGNSYLVKVIITGLMCRKGDLFLIENPEIHLHPNAQAKLGQFFCWIAAAGIQTIIETHSEHLINKIKYQIYRGEFVSDNAIIYYKPSILNDFIELFISKKGKFVNKAGDSIPFPSGFFDSTLQELLEIG